MEILSNSDVCVALVGQTNRSLVIALIPARAMDFLGTFGVEQSCSLVTRTWLWSNATQHNSTHNKIKITRDLDGLKSEYLFGICYASYASSYAYVYTPSSSIPIMSLHSPFPHHPDHPCTQTPTQSHSTAQNNKTINFRILHRHHLGPRGNLRNSES